MKRLMVIALAALAAAPAVAQPATAQCGACGGVPFKFSLTQICRIADPTGTNLNVRTAPHGKIVANMNNGGTVTLLDQKGRWVFVGDRDETPIGWVYRDFLDCR